MSVKLSKDFSFKKLDSEKEWAILFGRDNFELPREAILLISKCGTEIIDPIKEIYYPQVGYKERYLKINISYNSNYKYLLVHRLVAFAWLGIPGNYTKLIINHKDGNTKNNHVNNLEWTTKSLNNRHAFETGLRGNTSTVGNFVVYDFDEKITTRCFSITHVSAVTGLGLGYVGKLLDTPVITKKGKFIFSKEDNFDKLNLSSITEDTFLNYNDRSSRNIMNVKAENCETGEVTFFSKMSDASRELDIPLSSISEQCNDPFRYQKPLKGYIFTEVIDQAAPRDYLRKKGVIEEKSSNDSRRIKLLVHDRDLGVSMTFDWIGDFAEHASKKHGVKYKYKSIQHILLEKRKNNRELTWKEFDFIYLN